jgi:hypothetical protein
MAPFTTKDERLDVTRKGRWIHVCRDGDGDGDGAADRKRNKNFRRGKVENNELSDRKETTSAIQGAKEQQ